MAKEKTKVEKEEKSSSEDMKLDVDGTVEGAPIERIASRLTWPQEKSEIIRKEGGELIRTPDGAKKLEELLEEVDTTYFSRRQMFVEIVEKRIGKGNVSVVE
tara:strand:+ start:298 stop:603 length:306 start_codon:yes stop_codon:yes gene_type:complete